MILIADDDIAYADELAGILEGEDSIAKVCTVDTGAAAVDQLANAPSTSVVVLDMLLPYDENDRFNARDPGAVRVPTGLRVAKELIGKGFPSSQIVVVTAYHLGAAEEQLREIGIMNILRKPVPTSDLLRVIRILHR